MRVCREADKLIMEKLGIATKSGGGTHTEETQQSGSDTHMHARARPLKCDTFHTVSLCLDLGADVFSPAKPAPEKQPAVGREESEGMKVLF